MASKKQPRSPFRSYKSGLKIQWSSEDNPLVSLTFEADLVPPKDTAEDIKYERVCPACHKDKPEADATKLTSRYHCPANAKHGPFATAEVLNATKVGKALRVVATTEQVAEAREIDDDDPQKETLVLSAYDALEVETATYPIGTAYVCAVDPGQKPYSLLLAAVGHDGRINAGGGMPVTLIGEVVLRNNRKLMQVRRWGDQLVLQELARPDDLKQGFEARGTDLPDNAVAGLAAFFQNEAKPFKPQEFLNEQRARMQAFTASQLDPDAEVIALPTRTVAAAPDADDALMAALEASVTQAKKAPAKKAARTKKAS